MRRLGNIIISTAELDWAEWVHQDATYWPPGVHWIRHNERLQKTSIFSSLQSRNTDLSPKVTGSQDWKPNFQFAIAIEQEDTR